jgi:hypothetical protein
MTVSAASGDVTGGLGITIFDNADLLDTVAVTGGPLTGTASFTTTLSSLGAHTITAAFNGTSTVSASSQTTGITVIPDSSTTTVTATPNPSAPGQPVTLTATISAPAGDVTGGLGVFFFDGADQLNSDPIPVGGGPLSGTAALTTTFSTLGSHDITAAFSGTSTVGASSGTLSLSVATPSDSLHLRAMQLLATRMEALNSGAAFSSALGKAIYDAFSGGGSTLDVRPDGSVHLNYAPEAAGPAVPWPGTAGGKAPRAWSMWADFRGTAVGDWFNGDSVSTLSGLQLNALMGLTYAVSPNLLVGVIGGYETADYDSDALDGHLTANGWTLGGYAGARLGPSLRAFAAAGYSGLGYDVSSGAASASFGAGRWLLAGGVSGDIDLDAATLEPSLDLFGLWEHDDGYTDSLGTSETARDFGTGRVSAGVKLLRPFSIEGTSLAPYAGLYADYTAGGDTAGLDGLGLGDDAVLSSEAGGVSARLTGGVKLRTDSGLAVDFGGEFGGLGAPVQSWTLNGSLKQSF